MQEPQEGGAYHAGRSGAAAELRPVLEKREKAMITGVTEVESFDDGQIVLSTHGGRLILSGAGLHVSSLLLEEGKLSLEGTIDGLHYEGNGGKRRGSLLRRALK